MTQLNYVRSSQVIYEDELSVWNLEIILQWTKNGRKLDLQI